MLATATAGPSNLTRVGEARARESIREAIRQACAAAGVDARQVQSACIGAAGAGREEVASVIHTIMSEVVPGKVEVAGDMQIALHAAFEEGQGVVVIAGTGSIAYGRDLQGRTVRAGGWGFAVSDEGSAHWIGRQAITGLLRVADETGRDADTLRVMPLLREVKAAWKLNSVNQLAGPANSSADFANLLPAVLAAAGDGDELAQQILGQAAEELARLAAIVVRRLFSEDASPGPEVSMAMVGGVFRHAPMIREQFSRLVRAASPQVVVICEVVEPVLGALRMARRSAL
jgi:glucosamine kinase